MGGAIDGDKMGLLRVLCFFSEALIIGFDGGSLLCSTTLLGGTVDVKSPKSMSFC